MKTSSYIISCVLRINTKIILIQQLNGNVIENLILLEMLSKRSTDRLVSIVVIQ